MAHVLLNENGYQKNLDLIQKGFQEDALLRYDQSIKSTLTGMVVVHDEVLRLDQLLKSYLELVKNDMNECFKIGNIFINIDEAYRKALSNGDNT